MNRFWGGGNRVWGGGSRVSRCLGRRSEGSGLGRRSEGSGLSRCLGRRYEDTCTWGGGGREILGVEGRKVRGGGLMMVPSTIL